MNPGYVEEEITGIPTFEPSFHLPAIWITESQRERAESMGYTVVDPPSISAAPTIIRTLSIENNCPTISSPSSPSLDALVTNIPLADVNQGGDLLDRVVMIRRQIALELGAVVPIIRLRDNIQLNPTSMN